MRTIDHPQLKGAKMIEGNDELRAKKCLQEIEGVLAAYDCVMLPSVKLSPMGPEFNWSVGAKARQQGGNGGGEA